MTEVRCYTVDETAAILKLYKKTVYTHIRDGSIKAVKIGGRYRITENEINRLLGLTGPAAPNNNKTISGGNF